MLNIGTRIGRTSLGFHEYIGITYPGSRSSGHVGGKVTMQVQYETRSNPRLKGVVVACASVAECKMGLTCFRYFICSR